MDPDDATVDESMSEDAKEDGPPAGARTVLIVAPDAAERTELVQLLAADGRYEAIGAASGREGLEQCRAHSPDCVLLQYYLPDMDGAVFLHALRDEAGPSVPVVLLTETEDVRPARTLLERGAQGYLVLDSFTPQMLARTIETAIEMFEIRRSLEEKTAALELRTWQLEAVRDELQQRLVEVLDATRAKDQFLAVMSHELRTPLNAILGYADLMEMGVGGELPEAHQRHVERIRVGGRHLLDLINDVLDLSQPHGQKLELDIRPLDLEPVLEEVAALLDSQARVKGLSLEIEPLDAPLPPVMGDLRRLRQILTNLVGNAIKFTEKGGVAITRTAPGDGTVRVAVRDTGIGVAEDTLPLVFTEFFQAHGSLTRERGGSGLGLAIARRLAREMGGEILAESKLGEGSVFTLVLLAGDALAEPAEAEPQEEAVADSVGPEGEPSVAVVVAFGYDAATLAELERRVAQDVRLVWTTDPDDVPRLAREHSPTLVVLEVSNVDGSAWRIAHTLQDLPELDSAAVLLLPRIPTPSADDPAAGFDLGWVSLVPKPFTAEQLTHAVSRAAGAATDDAGYDVLVVDDDPDSRRVATRFLEDAGATVRQAPDGESALVSMRRHAPDVVVLDLMMPVLDGFGVLATMRADPLLAGIPVIVLSAKTLSEKERAFLARTTVRVLQKGEHRLADIASLVLRAAGGGLAGTAAGRTADRD